MKRARLRHSVEHFFFRGWRTLVLGRPHEEVRAFGHRLGRTVYLLDRRHRRLATANLERAFPQMADDERERTVRACFEHFGAHFCETLSLARLGAQEILDLFDVEGWERVEALEERMADSGRGFFLHSGHFGHWQTALYPISAALRPLHAVVRPFNNPLVDRDMSALRQRFGVDLIEKRGAAFRMRSACRRGGHVAILIDQHVRPSSGIRVPFLGHDAWTSPVLAMLALELEVPVVPIMCYPADEPGRYRLVVGEPLWGEGKGRDAEAAFTRRILADLEEHVRRRPELWLWMHRRWR